MGYIRAGTAKIHKKISFLLIFLPVHAHYQQQAYIKNSMRQKMALTRTRCFLSTVAIVLGFSMIIACNNDLVGIVPSDLIGTWSASNSGAYASACVGTWTFTSSTVGYEEVCDESAYNSSWEREVAEVWEDENYLRTDNDMYVAWHIDGNEIYVTKNNPYSSGPEPEWETQWWNDRSPFYKD